ncbi:B-cell antigen receptor complex-associated protein alpha chain [Trichomycterus rosablanca]|uniref:B-cell antigen receptor complex-associated protein alpha chain n=1 Tax=Trichomycterus rosablanca TaxID=2290929 RepID=UPI002F354C62
MEKIIVFFICFLAAAGKAEQAEIILKYDQPSLRIPVSHTATVRCCYSCKQCKPGMKWFLTVSTNKTFINDTKRMTQTGDEKNNEMCNNLKLENVTLNDTGLYQCSLTQAGHIVFTPGTFLHVYEPMRKTLNISESAKNSIITAEGVLLLICVVLPGTLLLCKSKGINELNKIKGKEEENIYEGLNLDECNSTYHQIQCSQQGPYQDVMNSGEDIQLEKP